MPGLAMAMDVAALLLFGRLAHALAHRPRPAARGAPRDAPDTAAIAEAALDAAGPDDVSAGGAEAVPDDAGRFAAMALLGASLILLSVPLWSG
ncbi:hypothetical protein [Actinomadura terrae]|uniref:hypothetical protein n=1 Tax=Actinomadura terrae TaxID=604353 RepID=UPI001FA75923|nr:hypothetical protein [Actinomadura terrae]